MYVNEKRFIHFGKWLHFEDGKLNEYIGGVIEITQHQNSFKSRPYFFFLGGRYVRNRVDRHLFVRITQLYFIIKQIREIQRTHFFIIFIELFTLCQYNNNIIKILLQSNCLSQ